MNYHVEHITDDIRKIVKACYPQYNGKTIQISDTPPKTCRSYWDGGSKRYYVLYSLSDGRTMEVGTNHPFFEPDKPYELRELPKDVLLVQHNIFQGKDLGITIFANQENMQHMLPDPMELPDNEIIVLLYTAHLKSSYAGQSNYRRYSAVRDNKITKEGWDAAKAKLIESKHLNKAGAITAKGRNAIENHPNRYLL